ncbi:cupredoxin domain-containing protein [Pseudonocardia sp. GCM10023141]|uniref:cupredoxin domain-containing protein n=1 Tax=Pseudonocardia sp. GCM10023141 TaxID=3252653 RepID=UPI0036224B2A
MVRAVRGCVLLGAALFGLAACGAPTSPVPVATGADTVTITMTDFQLTPNPATLTPGAYRFHAVNAGRTTHAIALSGPGVPEQRTVVLQPGQTADLTATVQPGEYDVYCPVDGHRAKGMETHLHVGAAAATPAPSSGDTGGY